MTTDITIAVVRGDLLEAGLTEQDLQTLEVSFDETCAQYIGVNPEASAIDADNLELTASITVAGAAPASECTVAVSDPAGIAEIVTELAGA